MGFSSLVYPSLYGSQLEFTSFTAGSSIWPAVRGGLEGLAPAEGGALRPAREQWESQPELKLYSYLLRHKQLQPLEVSFYPSHCCSAAGLAHFWWQQGLYASSYSRVDRSSFGAASWIISPISIPLPFNPPKQWMFWMFWYVLILHTSCGQGMNLHSLQKWCSLNQLQKTFTEGVHQLHREKRGTAWFFSTFHCWTLNRKLLTSSTKPWRVLDLLKTHVNPLVNPMG